MLLYGAPALSLEEFRDYKPDIIIGTSLEVTAPLGKYQSDRLLYVGTNRWSFKPEVGISKTLGSLTLEISTGIRFYTDNNNFLSGRTLEVNPLYSVQGHLIYFRYSQEYGWGSMGSTIPADAESSTVEKAKVSKMRASALRSHCQLIDTTLSSSTPAPMCTRRLERSPTC
jgi:hypothetical protein